MRESTSRAKARKSKKFKNPTPQKRHTAFGRHRRILNNNTYLLTKKCSDDYFLLTPNEELNKTLLFCMVLKAVKYNLVIHAFCFMSNHLHLVITDLNAKLPDFMREFLSISSKALQACCDIDRPIWDRKRYSAVHCLDLDAAERKIAYTMLNPARAGLTEPEDWPGLTSAIYSFGDIITAERPKGFFDPRYTPAVVSIQLTDVAPYFDIEEEKEKEEAKDTSSAKSTKEECEHSKERIEDLVNQSMDQIRSQLKDKGFSFLGREKVKAQNRYRRSKRKPGQFQPKFATRNKRLLLDAIDELRKFEIDHMLAADRWISGDRRVIFPAGTYGYKEWFCVKTRAA